MDTLATAPKAFNLREPIPGYVLRERIGAGGYGEVWRADAPGGLSKAVKIVYGPLKAGRAERELKALGRIKQVQHPMLLSLERIEMVDEHLIIVMELAHGSLKERFEKCVKAGEHGIPRAELLTYLRDVADALDFIYEEHSLQHLDVKPENLLLIANRVKVADFGLIKDLGDRSESLVGGLTPLYAPPEVFDGRPSRNSDQYSLAMVYQELLTGEPAFAGRTVAQLAAQHLHSSPCLAPLPKTDQPVIARALSKDPDRRFPSCRALIDSLTEAPKASNRVRRTATESTRITPTAEEAFPASIVTDEPNKQVAYPASSKTSLLPPIAFGEAGEDLKYHPAVFIGVGGTGAAVLRSLRSRLCQRFGNVDDIPSLQMLLLDTDVTALHNATRGERSSALRPNQLLPLTLKQPQEYRGEATSLLEWLNRRWLFNIPRSLTTEGIRALGRLALVDHFDAIANVLHHALSSVIDDNSIDSSTRTTGLRFVKAAPRIFVVASTAGGVGSGLVLDLGYLLRTMLEELHISDEQLHGVLVHSTSRRTNQRDLALANSLSLLTELHHYVSPSGYPGEPACKLPPRVGNSEPYRHTYVAHLGEELNEEEFAAGAARIGEYLYQNSVTNAAAFFDRCRDEDPDSAVRKHAAANTVRTFGLAQIGGANDAVVCEEANSLCRSLVAHWAGRQQISGAHAAIRSIDPEIENLARKFAYGMDLRLDKMLTWAKGILERQLVDSPQAYFQRRIASSFEQSAGSDLQTKRELAKGHIKNELLGQSEGADSIQSRLQAKVASVAESKRETLRDWFYILVDAPKSRVGGAQDAVLWYKEMLANLESQVNQAAASSESPADVAVDSEEQLVLRYAMRELDRITYDAVLLLIRALKAEVLLCEDLLREFARRILHLSNEFNSSRQPTTEADEALIRSLKEHHLELTRRLDSELTPALVRKHMSLSDLLNANSDVWTNLVSTMRTTAQRLAGSVIDRMQVLTMIQRGANSQHGAKHSGEQGISATDVVQIAKPHLGECGGDYRYLLVAPRFAGTLPPSWKAPFEETVGGPMNSIAGVDDALVVCCEAQGVPLQNIAAHLVGSRSDLLKVAGRLHTRIDVEWPMLERWLNER
ncbi:MAG: protein kinase [Planctomycetaceae bacterium]|nr:protein kinase [Planctomycetales bacterium]MCB9923687.1 protein kinase [Planctomycetaceae bacterium]